MKGLTVLLCCVLFAVLGCGPSIVHTYRSDRHFRFCYSAELTHKYAAQDQRSCWRSWLSRHARIASARDKRYAMSRIHASASISTVVRENALMADNDETSPEKQTPANEASSTAAPQHTKERVLGSSSSEPNASSNSLLPLNQPARLQRGACPSDCVSKFEKCYVRCQNFLEGCRKACELERRVCERACF